jgi:hypothetical protein
MKKKQPAKSDTIVLSRICKQIPEHLVAKIARKYGVVRRPRKSGQRLSYDCGVWERHLNRTEHTRNERQTQKTRPLFSRHRIVPTTGDFTWQASRTEERSWNAS